MQKLFLPLSNIRISFHYGFSVSVFSFHCLDGAFDGLYHLFREGGHEHSPDVGLQVAVDISVVYRSVGAFLFPCMGLLHVEESDVDRVRYRDSGILHCRLGCQGPSKASCAGVIRRTGNACLVCKEPVGLSLHVAVHLVFEFIHYHGCVLLSMEAPAWCRFLPESP